LKLQHYESERKTVMICDDDRDTLDLFVYVFKSRYNVISANSGGECIAKFLEEKNRGNQIHLLLLDYRLSDVSGDSVARKIKEYGGTKMILISASNIDDSLLKELEENQCITRFVKKPIHLSKLIEIVADTINKIGIVSQNG
jgi:CheY-like chemotaxis protein